MGAMYEKGQTKRYSRVASFKKGKEVESERPKKSAALRRYEGETRRNTTEPERTEYQELKAMRESNSAEVGKDMARNAMRLIGMKKGGGVGSSMQSAGERIMRGLKPTIDEVVKRRPAMKHGGKVSRYAKGGLSTAEGRGKPEDLRMAKVDRRMSELDKYLKDPDLEMVMGPNGKFQFRERKKPAAAPSRPKAVELTKNRNAVPGASSGDRTPRGGAAITQKREDEANSVPGASSGDRTPRGGGMSALMTASERKARANAVPGASSGDRTPRGGGMSALMTASERKARTASERKASLGENREKRGPIKRKMNSLDYIGDIISRLRGAPRKKSGMGGAGLNLLLPMSQESPGMIGATMKKGGKVESKKMMRKEVAFMKKKGAPKSMIKHEEAEMKGTKKKAAKVKKYAAGGMIPSAGKKSPSSMGTPYRAGGSIKPKKYSGGGGIDGCAVKGKTRAPRRK